MIRAAAMNSSTASVRIGRSITDHPTRCELASWRAGADEPKPDHSIGDGAGVGGPGRYL